MGSNECPHFISYFRYFSLASVSFEDFTVFDCSWVETLLCIILSPLYTAVCLIGAVYIIMETPLQDLNHLSLQGQNCETGM